MSGDAQNGVEILRASGDDIIQVDPTELTAFAEKLRAQAAEIEGIASGLGGVKPSLASLGSQFMVANDPRPVYEGTVGQLTRTTEAFEEQLKTLATQLTADADALEWIAGQFTQFEVNEAADIRRIIDSVEPPSS
jgi:uncharacterized protein YukE